MSPFSRQVIREFSDVFLADMQWRIHCTKKWSRCNQVSVCFFSLLLSTLQCLTHLDRVQGYSRSEPGLHALRLDSGRHNCHWACVLERRLWIERFRSLEAEFPRHRRRLPLVSDQPGPADRVLPRKSSLLRHTASVLAGILTRAVTLAIHRGRWFDHLREDGRRGSETQRCTARTQGATRQCEDRGRH